MLLFFRVEKVWWKMVAVVGLSCSNLIVSRDWLSHRSTLWYDGCFFHIVHTVMRKTYRGDDPISGLPRLTHRLGVSSAGNGAHATHVF